MCAVSSVFAYTLGRGKNPCGIFWRPARGKKVRSHYSAIAKTLAALLSEVSIAKVQIGLVDKTSSQGRICTTKVKKLRSLLSTSSPERDLRRYLGEYNEVKIVVGQQLVTLRLCVK